MDAFARALLAAEAILDRSEYTAWRSARYASFDSGQGKDFESGKLSLEDLAHIAGTQSEPLQRSGQQERFENLLSRFV